MTETSRTAVSHPYLDTLAERVLVYDGAMGTNIQRHNPTAEDFGGKALEGCNDHLVLTRPDIIQSIHESFLAVGCDVVETCTFQSTPHRLREWGLEEKTRDINVHAARLRCRAFLRLVGQAQRPVRAILNKPSTGRSDRVRRPISRGRAAAQFVIMLT